MQTHYRQGDILIVRYKRFSTFRARKVANGVILAGEHNHILLNGTVYHRNSFTLSRREPYWRLMVAFTHAKVVHEEHHPISLPEGYYGVIRQREFSGFNGRSDWTWVWD